MPNPFDAMTNDQLEEIMGTAQEDGSITLPVPVVAPVEAPVEAATEDPEPVPESEPEPEEPVDYKALAEQRERELQESRAHNSRLAGQIGYLKSKGAAPVPDATVEPAADDDNGGVDPSIAAELETLRFQREEDQKRIERLENEYDVNLFERTMDAASKHAEMVVGEIKPEDTPAINAVIARHADLIADLKARRDPEMIAAGAKYICETTAAEILAARNQRMAQRREASTASFVAAKKAATISGSGGSTPPAPKQKSFDEMSAKEADEWLRANVR